MGVEKLGLYAGAEMLQARFYFEEMLCEGDVFLQGC